MATAVKDPLVGRLVDARYLVHDKIASGGMATVYLATDTRLERPVALKVMHSHLAADASFVARFTREARSAARLSHPGVVSVYDQGAGDGTVYLAMEYIPGRTLRDLLAEEAPLPLGDALDLIEEVLDGLAAAHTAGLVHRDVKPENVLVGDDGRLRVADFGLARAATTATGGATSTLIGTVGYLAPELVLDGASDERADVYAAGVVLYELLTGRAPFAGGAPAQVAFRHVSQDLPLVSQVRPGVPEGVDALVASATDREPARRPRDAGVMLDQVRTLRDALSDAVLDAPAVVVPDPSTVPVTRDGTRVHPHEHVAALPVADLREAAEGLASTRALPTTDQPRTSSPAQGQTQSRAPRPTARSGRAASRLALPPDAEEAAPAPRRQRQRRVRPAVLALVVGLLVVLIGGGGVAAWAFTAGPLARVAVPLVGRVDYASAAAQIQGRDLVAERTEAYDDDVPEGQVVRTDPAAGQRVSRNSTVTVVVSEGVELHTVPDLTGMTRDEATQAVTDADLTVGTVVEGYSEDQPAGRVASQQTPTSSPLATDGKVSFTVSKGREPVTAPEIDGRPLADVEKDLADAGLVRGRVDRQFDDTVPKDSVISSKVPTGTLNKGAVIDLVVSDGPEQVQVPAVTGKSLSDARDQLRGLGLQVQENRFWVGETVQGQDPQPGAEVDPGSTVTLTYG